MIGEGARPAESAHCSCRSRSPPMRLLQYKDLDLKRVKPAFAKVRAAIEAGDFKSPDVKKLHTGGYYRAKLDHSNRLLLQFARHGGETVCLALEVIENHAYDKSRFLRGAPVDEAKIEREPDRRAGAVRRRTRSRAPALAARHARRVRTARQTHRLRRRPGGRAPPAGAGGAGRLGRLGQDGRHAGQAARSAGQGAVRHPVGLPGAVGALRCTTPTATRTRPRKPTS